MESQHTKYHGEQPAGFVGYRELSVKAGECICVEYGPIPTNLWSCYLKGRCSSWLFWPSMKLIIV